MLSLADLDEHRAPTPTQAPKNSKPEPRTLLKRWSSSSCESSNASLRRLKVEASVASTVDYDEFDLEAVNSGAGSSGVPP
eukprot:1837062-Alexandrium_andersonii.AAC.1